MLFYVNAGIKLHINNVVAIFLFHLINFLILWFLFSCLMCFVLRTPTHQCVSTMHQPISHRVVTILKRFVMCMLQIFIVKICGNFREYQVWYHEISPAVIGIQ